jgi:hypothetical protein
MAGKLSKRKLAGSHIILYGLVYELAKPTIDETIAFHSHPYFQKQKGEFSVRVPLISYVFSVTGLNLSIYEDCSLSCHINTLTSWPAMV